MELLDDTKAGRECGDEAPTKLRRRPDLKDFEGHTREVIQDRQGIRNSKQIYSM